MLVAVRSVGVCGSDVHYFQHGRIGDFVLRDPLVLGHEVSGRIVAAGPGADPGRLGRRVAIEPGAGCGRCPQCRSGRYNLCPDMRFFATPPVNGAFGEYVLARADLTFDLPDQVSDDAAALLEPLSVGIWAAGKAGLHPGQLGPHRRSRADRPADRSGGPGSRRDHDRRQRRRGPPPPGRRAQRSHRRAARLGHAGRLP